MGSSSYKKTKTDTPTVSNMMDAMSVLRGRGWEHTLSATKAGPSKDYGLLFERGAERFWLNRDTMNSLPR
jgi:hypothetical protein